MSHSNLLLEKDLYNEIELKNQVLVKTHHRNHNNTGSLKNPETKDHEQIELVRVLNSVECEIYLSGYNYVYKQYYFCACDPDQKEPICHACATICHQGHKTTISQNPISAICNCGMKCHNVINLNDNECNQGLSQVCHFFEWSLKAKILKYYEGEFGNFICLFCANICEKWEKCTEVKVDTDNFENYRQCNCNNPIHGNLKHLYDEISKISELDKYHFGELTHQNIFNLLIDSGENFKNLYSSFINYKNNFELEVVKPDFIFENNISYSIFNYALRNIATIASKCVLFNYFTPIIGSTFQAKFVFQMLIKPFDYKSQSIWAIQNNILTLFRKCIFLKSFSMLPHVKVGDIIKLNPLQRQLILSNVKEIPGLMEQYINSLNLNVLEDCLNTIVYMINIKDNDLITFKILKQLYSILKSYAKYNLMSQEQVSLR